MRGRVDAVLDEFRIGPKSYFVLERLGRRERFRVFDPSAGLNGDYRVVHFLPRGKATEQQLEVLRRFSEKNLHFPKILECQRRRDDIALITTWVWGVNLAEYLRAVRERKQPRPSIPECVRLVNKLAHGLAHLHVKANVVHGDVKPANLVLEKDPTRLVLIDFGSAWPAERATRKAPGDGLTVPYAAPEQCSADAAPDFRADVFSLGVVLFEMLTLEIPFEGAGGQAGLPENAGEFPGTCETLSSKIGDPSRFPRDAVRSLDAFLQDSLALDRNKRFASRSEWLDAFDEAARRFREAGRLGFFGRTFLSWLDRLSGR
ncbi:MAG: protein kinase [Gemmataceae bacterium]|nr:protein kinase [Gemmataceae bacterium]